MNNIFHLFDPSNQQKLILFRILLYHYTLCKGIKIIEEQREDIGIEKWSKRRDSNIDKAKYEAIFDVDKLLNNEEYKIEFSSEFSPTLQGNKFPDTNEFILRHIKEAMMEKENKIL